MAETFAPGRVPRPAAQRAPSDVARTMPRGVSTPTPTPTPTPTAPRPRLYGLDALRFLAALAVVAYHYTARTSSAWFGRPPVETFGGAAEPAIYGALGPEFFFVISGFVILMTAWGRSVPQVVASRAARLYPSYWAAVIMTSVLLLWLWPEGKDITGEQAAVNLTMLQSLFKVGNVDGVYWTLWTELRFYLLIIAFVAIGITRERILWFCALWPLAALGASQLGMPYASMFLIEGFAPLFAGGMLIYLIYREGSSLMPWLLLAGNIALAVAEVVPVQLEALGRNTAYQPSALVLGALVVAFFAVVAAVSLTPLRSMGWPWLASLGMLTYPLYLTHQHWGWWMIQHLSPHVPPAVLLPLTMAAALAAAWLLYHGYEKHVGPRMRRSIERALTPREPAVTA